MRRETELRRPHEAPRILQFVNSFHIGGTEGQVVELLRGLLPRWRAFAATLHMEGPHLAAVRELGIAPFETPVPGSLARPHSMTQAGRLARWLRAQRIELVHAHDFYSALLGVPAARLAGVRVVVGRLDMAHWMGPGKRMAIALTSHAADHVIANAAAIRTMLVENEHLPLEQVSVIPNGIDLARFDHARGQPLAAPLPETRCKVTVVHFANTTHPVKAQEDLFEAVRLLAAERPALSVLLVGDGPRRQMLERLVDQLGIRAYVSFLGKRSDVPAILSRSDIGVLCSHAEGLSNAIIEGMAASLPMVVTAAGGNAELVRDGESGFVVPVKSPALLAARLRTLMESRPRRLEMGQAARAFGERELGIEKLVSRHEALYRALLQRPDAVPVPERQQPSDTGAPPPG